MGGGRRMKGEIRRKAKSRNMYKGSMDKDNRGRGGLNVREVVGRAGESNGGKMGTTVIGQQ